MATTAKTPAQQKKVKQPTFQHPLKDPSDPLLINTPARSGRPSATSLGGMTPPALSKAAPSAHEAAQRRLTAPATKPPAMLLLPETPRRLHEAAGDNSPPGAPKSPAMPPLMAALCTNDEAVVARVLQSEPGAAQDLFWEHGADPPLCWAVRNRCSEGVVRLLLEHSADVTAADARGKTPLSILGSTESLAPAWDLFNSPERWLPTSNAFFACCYFVPGQVPGEAGTGFEEVGELSEKVRKAVEISKLLTKARADPFAADATGMRPIDLAAHHGNCHLELLWRGNNSTDAIMSGVLNKVGAEGEPFKFGQLAW